MVEQTKPTKKTKPTKEDWKLIFGFPYDKDDVGYINDVGNTIDGIGGCMMNKSYDDDCSRFVTAESGKIRNGIKRGRR